MSCRVRWRGGGGGARVGGVELRSVSGEAGQNCGSREVVQHSSSGGQHFVSGGQHFLSGEPENVMASV